MRADITTAVLAECTTDVSTERSAAKPGKNLSESLIVGTNNQLHAVTSSVSYMSVVGVDLPVAEEMKVLGVVLESDVQ